MKRHFSVTLTGSLLILILNIVSGIITARTLGPGGKGIMRTLIIWPSLLSQIALMGMNEAYIYLKNQGSDSSALKSTIFFGVLFISGFFSLLLLLLFFTLFRDVINSPFILSLIFMYIPVANSIQVGLSFIQEKMEFLKYNLLRALLPLTYLLLLVINYRTLTPQKCFFFLFLSNILLLLFLLPDFFKLNPSLIRKESLRESIGFGIKTQLASIIGSFSQQTDQAILSLISTPKALGIYSVAVSISRIGALAPNAAQIVLYPRMSKDKNYSLKKNIAFLFLFNLILYLLLILTLKKLILLFYGQQFLMSTKIALILFITAFPLSLIHVGTAHFKATGNPVKTTVAQIIIFITLAIFIPLLYIAYGLIGVAFASVIAYCAGAIYYLMNMGKGHGYGR